MAHQGNVSLPLEQPSRHRQSRANAAEMEQYRPDEDLLQAKAASSSELQTARLSSVGSTPQTKATIEISFKRFIEILAKLLK
jgi:hypothetical protein